ncbi:MAG: hypothetical protein ACK5YW_17020 [Betaproteobacteria bacterium]|jgi:ElaB/YqjD/DUF883 family membrane-anchored ribosome-binding protein|nr:hypothetical protein [Rhodocyclaceae bacterium]
MTVSSGLKAELDAIRAELSLLRQQAGPAEGEAGSAGAGPWSTQLAELNRLVQDMLADAEETVAEHPVATIAGALALGILIGRLTAR